MMTIEQIKARTEAMTASMFKRMAENPTRRDKLHTNRTAAIDRRDFAAMNEITRRIAKLETK